MFNYLKTSAAAIVVAALPLAAAAVPVNLVNGGSDVIDGNEDYRGIVANDGSSPGFWQFKFISDFDRDATAFATVSPANFAGFTDLTISWVAADGMRIGDVLTLADVVSGDNTLSTSFTSPGELQQYLRFDWASSDGAGGFDVEVSLAAVPVPAAGLMLLTALGGAAAMRRRAKA